MYQHLYSEFLKRHTGFLHFAAHSHHFWPDVTRQALLEYWEDSAQLVDHKWEKIMGEKVPATQKLIAKHLNFSRSQDITFASSTHDFLVRILSTFKPGQKIKVLTTDSEFYSFERQIRRYEELGMAQVTRINSRPFVYWFDGREQYEGFETRFEEALKSEDWDIIFLSHVFFNSGVAVRNLEKLVSSAPTKSIFILDGYHSYMALPVDLSRIGDRIFFMAGGYKYAQSGEGCCFMTLPKNCELKPSITGWFAEMGNLQNFGNEVPFSTDGYRFAGSTMDYTALYRMLAVLELFEKEQITVQKIHDHVLKQQKYFLEAVPKLKSLNLNMEQILGRPNFSDHGHFFTFEMESPEACAHAHDELRKRKILTDYRKSRLRFGFALYHEGSSHL